MSATAAIAEATERAAGRSLVTALSYQCETNRLLRARGWTQSPMLTAEQLHALDFAYQNGLTPAQFVEQLLAFEAGEIAEAVAS
jgi:hypothetical protein